MKKIIVLFLFGILISNISRAQLFINPVKFANTVLMTKYNAVVDTALYFTRTGVDSLKISATPDTVLLDFTGSYFKFIPPLSNLPGLGGTVTNVSVTTANGVSGSVANPTTTPAISLTLGAITPSSVNGVTVSGSSSPTITVIGPTTVSGVNTGNQTITLTSDVTGSGTGSFATTIANDAVTFAKFQNITCHTNSSTGCKSRCGSGSILIKGRNIAHGNCIPGRSCGRNLR